MFGNFYITPASTPETGVYRRPSTCKLKPKPAKRKYTRKAKPEQETVTPHVPPNQPEPQLAETPPPKQKRKYTKRAAKWFTKAKSDAPEHDNETPDAISPVQEELHAVMVESACVPSATPCVAEEDQVIHEVEHDWLHQTFTLTQPSHHAPGYIWTLAKPRYGRHARRGKLVTKQLPGDYVKGHDGKLTHLPGCTVPDGQCSKCRVFASPRIPIYYSTYMDEGREWVNKTSGKSVVVPGDTMPYLCDRCWDKLAMLWWNAEEEPLHQDVTHFYNVKMCDSMQLQQAG